MIKIEFDPEKPYRFVMYGRMSDDAQNKRSPDQQFSTARETIARAGYPWIEVQTYRDDGISGRYVGKRPGFQKMLSDIELGIVVVDLIVVDTYERFGRAEEIADLRRRLETNYGVLVVAADTRFADPTGIVGKTMSVLEQFRATEDGRVKAHNVLRGKKDAARQKHWPGGPAPFGFKLKRVIDDSQSPPQVETVLEHEPREADIMRKVFIRADETGEGATKLSQWWNSNPEIPDEFKPCHAATMGARLENPIYMGTLRFGAKQTDVKNDARVIRNNQDGPELIPDFCEPIVEPALFLRVNAVRKARSERHHKIRQAVTDPTAPTRLIPAVTPGLALKHPLSGLLRCSECNSSLRPMPSGRRGRGGRLLLYYTCHRSIDRACENRRYYRAEQMEDAVWTLVREVLFPTSSIPGTSATWLNELVGRVRDEVERQSQVDALESTAYLAEITALHEQERGWLATLGNPQLAFAVRNAVESQYAAAVQRRDELERMIDRERAIRQQLGDLVSVERVIDELQRLTNTMQGANPTLIHLELSRHIQMIVCCANGEVRLQGTYLGVFSGVEELLSKSDGLTVTRAAPNGVIPPVRQRSRSRLRLPSLSAVAREDLRRHSARSAHDSRTEIPEALTWTRSFVATEASCWSTDHALEVATLRSEGWTHQKLADHFEVTVPTIRKAIATAKKTHPELKATLQLRIPRTRWADTHLADVAAAIREGLSLKKMCQRFGKCLPIIKQAIRLLEASDSSDSEQS